MESSKKDDLDMLRKLTESIVKNDIEDRDIEQKSRIDFSSQWHKAELVRDFLSLANPPYADPPNPDYQRMSYLVVGSKDGKFLVDAVEDLPEESNVRGILNAYVYPPVQFSYKQFSYEVNGDLKWVGVFVIRRTGRIHEVSKKIQEGKVTHLGIGESWTRPGGEKVRFTPEMKEQVRALKQFDIRTPVLRVVFHNDGLVEEMRAIECRGILGPHIEKRLDELRHTYDSISNKVVRCKDELSHYPQDDETKSGFRREIVVQIGGGHRDVGSPLDGPSKPVVVSDKSRQTIKNAVEVILGEDWDESFVDLGGLRYTTGLPTPSGMQVKHHGTEDEKEKHRLLRQFERVTLELMGLGGVLGTVCEAYVLPLALSNEKGTIPDEDVRVQLFFPPGVRILTEGDFEYAPPESIDELVQEGGILDEMVAPTEDPEVKLHGVETNLFSSFLPPDIYGNRDRDRTLELEYQSYLRQNFQHTTFDYEGGTIVEYVFGYVKHNETLSFGTHLLVVAEETFEISYRIKSKHHPDVQTGSIIYHIPTAPSELDPPDGQP